MPIPFLDIANIGIGLINKIPSGKGKRKAAIEFMRPEIARLSIQRGKLEMAANALMEKGDVSMSLYLQSLADNMAVTQSIMQVTADAIGDDTPEQT